MPRGSFLSKSWIVAAMLCWTTAAPAADLTVKAVIERLVKSTHEQPADFSGRDLSFLDLSDLDFKAARLAGVDLYGSDLSHANLAGADLSGARLDRTVIIGTDFSGANLSGASLLRPAAFSTFEVRRDEAPRFAGANLSGARLFGRFGKCDWRGANLAAAQLGPGRGGQQMLPMLSRTDLAGCNLAGANLAGADLIGASLAFTDLTGANLSDANLAGADLSRANMTGADVTGANLTAADLDGTVLRGAKGLAQARGLDAARHRAAAVE
jgi:uncharacterized protein YjbI with pentapeptide repeats